MNNLKKFETEIYTLSLNTIEAIHDVSENPIEYNWNRLERSINGDLAFATRNRKAKILKIQKEVKEIRKDFFNK